MPAILSIQLDLICDELPGERLILIEECSIRCDPPCVVSRHERFALDRRETESDNAAVMSVSTSSTKSERDPWITSNAVLAKYICEALCIKAILSLHRMFSRDTSHRRVLKPSGPTTVPQRELEWSDSSACLCVSRGRPTSAGQAAFRFSWRQITQPPKSIPFICVPPSIGICNSNYTRASAFANGNARSASHSCGV